MIDDTLTAEGCERRAKECREMARNEPNPEASARFEQMALVWDSQAVALRDSQTRPPENKDVQEPT